MLNLKNCKLGQAEINHFIVVCIWLSDLSKCNNFKHEWCTVCTIYGLRVNGNSHYVYVLNVAGIIQLANASVRNRQVLCEVWRA